MAAKIFIKHVFPSNRKGDMLDLVQQLRVLASKQSGYIYGETLKSENWPEECLVLSTWYSIDSWKSWHQSRIRRLIQEKIDQLTGCKTEYRVYEHMDC